MAARDSGGTVPEQLVRCGFIDDEELTGFYRSRLLIPRINPSELARLSASLLGRVPADMAPEFRSIHPATATGPAVRAQQRLVAHEQLRRHLHA